MIIISNNQSFKIAVDTLSLSDIYFVKRIFILQVNAVLFQAKRQVSIELGKVLYSSFFPEIKNALAIIVILTVLFIWNGYTLTVILSIDDKCVSVFHSNIISSFADLFPMIAVTENCR